MSGAIRRLGSVSCPSGKLVILDGGWAWLWSHDRSPVHPRMPMIVGAAESARDLAIHGPDALAAGRAFERSDNPLYVFDIAGDQVDATQAAFAALAAEQRFDAAIEMLDARVPHRRRVDLSLDVGTGLGAVNFHGMTAIAVGGVPRDRDFQVLGEIMPDGKAWCWRRVWVEFDRGEHTQHRLIGHVTVDEARLMTIDADILGLWDDVDPSDGKADVVFWGGEDAQQVAHETQAAAIDDGIGQTVFGWLDLPAAEAEKRAEKMIALQSDTKRFALDLRPHTHQWALLSQVRRTETSSGELELGGARVCMFHTLLGNGWFPVYGESDAEGRVLRAVIEFADDDEASNTQGSP